MYTDVGVAAGVCVGVFRANRGEMTRKAGNGNRNGEEGPETTRDGGGGSKMNTTQWRVFIICAINNQHEHPDLCRFGSPDYY